MKKLVLIIGGVVLILFLACGGMIGGMVWWGLSITERAVEGATDFLALVGEGKTGEAYRACSTSFKTTMDEEAFARLVKSTGLKDYASASWSSRSVDNNQATVAGTVTTKRGGRIPITINLIWENEAWRVLALSAGPGAIQPGAGRAKTSEWR
jgi:hypothetical protein